MTGWPRSVTMLGCGNMGGAMLDRWLAAGLPPERVTVVNRSGVAPRAGIITRREPPPAPPAPPGLLVSILAGVELATLRARLPARAHVRALPNLPVSLGRGVTLLHGDAAGRALADRLAAPLGLAEWLDDEALFDAATALAGSGPGFVFRIVDALAAAGTTLGLPPAQAARLALTTVAGSAELAARADVAPGELARRVASKGGSTQAGYDVLDADAALVDLLTRTLRAATRRNTEMGAAARSA